MPTCVAGTTSLAAEGLNFPAFYILQKYFYKSQEKKINFPTFSTMDFHCLKMFVPYLISFSKCLNLQHHQYEQ